jgi:beta-glucosidase-like glycosyl hydrolase/CubicO group peptidase (beta-lactamase class C family)
MKRYFLWGLLLFIVTTLSAQIPTNFYNKVDKQKMSTWVDSVYRTMTVEEKVGQLFMPIVELNERGKAQVATYIQNQKIGGILFGKGTLSTQAEITRYAQQISKIPLFIALDGEWGLSMRLADAPQFPRNEVLGAITNDTLLYRYGAEIARQCQQMGIHINFAPTLDVNTNPNNPVIGTRSYGADPQNVARKGIAYSRGLEDNGVMAVAKHFPGHGNTSEDSHKTLPTVNLSADQLNEIELFPFRKYIEAGLSGLMIGHLNVPALQTNGQASSLSPNVGEKLLKEKEGFTGLVFTDGMAMKAVAKQPDMSVKALLAGNDIVLGTPKLSQEFESVKSAVDRGIISQSMLEEKVKKILAYKYILGVSRKKPADVSDFMLKQQIGTGNTEWLQRKLYDNALTLLKNETDLVPLKHLETKTYASVAIGEVVRNDFQKMLRKYDNVKDFQVSTPDDLAKIEQQLSDYNIVIFSIHNTGLKDAPLLQKLVEQKNGILVFFTSPSETDSYKLSVSKAKAVLIAQDNSAFAQMSAAQGIFGGISISGKLQVPTTGFELNHGIRTNKIRLAYNVPEEVGIASANLKNIETIAYEGIRNKAYPGCVVLVAKDGVVIYEKAFGNFEYGLGSRVTDETVYDLASVTKASATLPAVMKLFDEKKLKLQDPISKFVPETKHSNKAGISVQELLFHESGITPFIPYYESAIDKRSYSGPLFGPKSETYNAYYAGAWGRTDYKFRSDLIASQPSNNFNLPVAKDLYAGKKMHDVLLKDIIDTPLKNRGRYAYSCLNFMLLKEAVEHISGQDLNTYVQENFYRKLGAYTTTFQPLEYLSFNDIPPTENDPFFRKQLVRGYVHDEGAALFGGISGNAGLFSTANDLAKLFQMWLNKGKYGDERFLSEETVNLFTTKKSMVSRRGLGFDKPDPKNPRLSPTGTLTPESAYGHTGFTGTCFWIDPENNLIYIFLSNRVYPSRTPNKLSTLNIRERIQDEIYKAIDTKKDTTH